MLIGEFDKVASSRFDPDVMRELVTGDGFTEVLDGLDAAAPVEIAADVEADTDGSAPAGATSWRGTATTFGASISTARPTI